MDSAARRARQHEQIAHTGEEKLLSTLAAATFATQIMNDSCAIGRRANREAICSAPVNVTIQHVTGAATFCAKN